MSALRSLEALPAPDIVATSALTTTSGEPRVAVHRSYVPDNVGDKVAGAWARGRDGSLADFRTEKDVRSLRLPEGATVSYVYSLPPELRERLAVAVTDLMRSVTHLGWGIDQVVGNAHISDAPTEGERWTPSKLGSMHLRAPTKGTLAALEARHQAFLGRLPGDDLLVPVPPLSAFDRVRYGRADAVEPRPFLAFRIVEPETGDRLALDPVRRTRDVSAWLRNKVGELTSGWEFGDSGELVHGHPAPEQHGGTPETRFAYLPIPTIAPYGKGQARRATDIARVILAAPRGKEVELLWLENQLLGESLRWDDRDVAVLEFLPAQDAVLQWYANREKGARTWTTITPVVLPGLDDRAGAKTEKLLRRAFAHAGFSTEVVNQLELDWSKTGFFGGIQHADRYLAPDKVSGPQYHVRVTFPSEVHGPIAVGSGRYRGLGTFIAERSP